MRGASSRPTGRSPPCRPGEGRDGGGWGKGDDGEEEDKGEEDKEEDKEEDEGDVAMDDHTQEERGGAGGTWTAALAFHCAVFTSSAQPRALFQRTTVSAVARCT